MTALFEGLTHWHWLGLGFALLAIEVLGSVGFLLWTGIAALEVGLLLLVWPSAGRRSCCCLACNPCSPPGPGGAGNTVGIAPAGMPPPHQRADAGLSGPRAGAADDVTQGMSRVHLDDTAWTVRCNQPLSAGSKVRVTGHDSHILLVEPLP